MQTTELLQVNVRKLGDFTKYEPKFAHKNRWFSHYYLYCTGQFSYKISFFYSFTLIQTTWLENASERPSFAEIAATLSQGM